MAQFDHAVAILPPDGEKHEAMTNVRYRLGPNYSFVRRVLEETRGLLGRGRAPGSFRPARVLDFGSGVGSSSAAALDVFGVSRKDDAPPPDPHPNADAPVRGGDGIDWIHSINASRSMRETSEKLLRSLMEGALWDAERAGEERAEDDQAAECERIQPRIRGDAAAQEKRLERQRRRLRKWERTWTRRTNHRTRLTFGESIVDASSFPSAKDDMAR